MDNNKKCNKGRMSMNEESATARQGEQAGTLPMWQHAGYNGSHKAMSMNYEWAKMSYAKKQQCTSHDDDFARANYTGAQQKVLPSQEKLMSQRLLLALAIQYCVPGP
eukprot:1140961-Pelagomonas_calceolata.AAC.6